MPPKENEMDEEYQERMSDGEIASDENWIMRNTKKEEYYKNKKLYGKISRKF